MSFCEAWPIVAVQLRAVQQLGVAFAGVDDRGGVRLDGVDATPDVHHLVDVLLDELHRGHHLADALTGEILEVAGLEDRDDAFLDFLAKQLLLVGRGVLGQRGRGLVDCFGGFESCRAACSVPPTTAPSSPLTLAISPPSKLLPCSVAISRLVRLMAS